MKQIFLNTIPELHTLNMVLDLMPSDYERTKVLARCKLGWDIWDYLNSSDHLKTLKGLSPEKQESRRSKLSLLKRIMDKELEVVRSVKTGNFYLEGCKDEFLYDPLARAVNDSGNTIIYLDTIDELREIDKLVLNGACNLKLKNEQIERENRWVKRILEHLNKDNSHENYLIVGAGHIFDHPNFSENLKREAISLAINPAFIDFDREYRLLYGGNLK